MIKIVFSKITAQFKFTLSLYLIVVVCLYGGHVCAENNDALFIDGKGNVKILQSLEVSGNIGIGVSNPKEKLEVKGALKAQKVEAAEFVGGSGSIAGPLTIKSTLSAGKVYSHNIAKEAFAKDQISTKSKTWQDMKGLSIKIDMKEKRRLYIHLVISEAWAGENQYAFYRLILDNKEIGNARIHWVSRHSSVVILRMPEVDKGPHTIKAQWKSNGHAQSLSTRTLIVKEL